jgi:hypothetical protein
MTTLAERGRTAHRYGIIAAARETVTFQRGTKTCTIEDAIRTEATYDVQGPDGLMTQVSSIDWFLPQDNVLIGGEQVEPKTNDRIIDADDKTFEPMKLSPNQPAVIPHCRNEFWCVHTKEWKQ